jgi:hypothetical protein
MAAAFREELNNFLEGMPKTEDWEVSDSELIFLASSLARNQEQS